MRSLLKIVLGALALLVLLAVAAIIAVAVLVDPNDYRDDIAAAVEERTGRQLAIDGDLSLKLLPCCGLGLGRTTLSNPPGFPDSHFASLEEARLGLRLWPLITRREVLIGNVRLAGLDLSLTRMADGRVNWDFPAAGDAPPPPAPEDAGDADAPISLSIAGLEISDARIAYRDEVEDQDLLLEIPSLATGPVAPGQPFDLEASLRAADRAADLRVAASLRARVTADPDGSSASFEDLQLDLDAEGAALEGGQATADVKIDNVAVQADETVTASAQAVSARMAFDGPALPGGGARATAELAQLKYAGEGGRLDGLVVDLTAAGAELRVEGEGEFAEGGSGLAGRFALAPLSPRQLMKTLDIPPPETSDAAVLSEFESSGQWRVGSDSVALTDLALRLDDTRVTGSAGVSQFDSPRLRFDFSADRIDLDRYLPPESEDDAAEAPAEEAGDETDSEALRDLYLDGDLQLGELVVAGAKVQALKTTVKARDGIITMDPMTAVLYDGTYQGRVEYDVSGDLPRLATEQTLDAVQIGGLLRDMFEIDKIEGRADARVAVAGQGLTDPSLRRSMAGDLSFELSDGLYTGMDIWHEIRRAYAAVKGRPAPERTGPAQTRITELSMNSVIADGVLRTDRLVGQIPFLQLSGTGRTDLVDQGIDYRIEASVLKTPEFADGETLDELTGLVIPLTLSGSVESPKVGVDLGDLLKNVATKELQDKVLKELGLDEESEDEAQSDDPEDLIKRGLRDLLGR